MNLKDARPIFDPGTHYIITVQGRVDVEWLQSFDSSVMVVVDESRPTAEITALTDQAGIVGLVRRLHGLGITILQVQVVSGGENAANMDEHC